MRKDIGKGMGGREEQMIGRRGEIVREGRGLEKRNERMRRGRGDKHRGDISIQQ